MRVWWDEFSKMGKHSDPDYPNGKPLQALPSVKLDGRVLKMIAYANDETGVVHAYEAVGSNADGSPVDMQLHVLMGKVEITLPKLAKSWAGMTSLGYTAVTGT